MTDLEGEVPTHLAPLKPKLRDLVLTLSDGSRAEVLSTELYTVIQTFWSVDWIYKVYDAEREVGRAICGWPTHDSKPCKNNPVPEERIENVQVVGKCGLHSKPSALAEDNDMHIKEVSFDSYGEVTELPAYKTLMSIAEDLLPTCTDCDFRFKCKDRDKELDRCAVQRRIFEKFMVGILRENKLVDITDQMLAFTLVTAFIDYIKTLQYEAYTGLSDTVSGGWMGLRLQLNRVIQRNMRTLGVDRKTKLFVKRDGHRVASETDIARLLADSDMREITAESRSMTVTSVKAVKPIVNRTFQGVDGELIEDREVDLEHDD